MLHGSNVRVVDCHWNATSSEVSPHSEIISRCKNFRWRFRGKPNLIQTFLKRKPEWVLVSKVITFSLALSSNVSCFCGFSASNVRVMRSYW